MRIALMTAATVLTIASSTLLACNDSRIKASEKSPIPTAAEMVARGEYLVATIGCDDCHSPKRMGAKGPELIPELRLSGYPASRPLSKISNQSIQPGYVLLSGDLTEAIGPWGTSYASNITSSETGIGNWTEQNFITAIRTGKSKGLENARPLLPPMPWMNFAKMTDEDLKSIFAYLKSTPAVENRVPAPLPPTSASTTKPM